MGARRRIGRGQKITQVDRLGRGRQDGEDGKGTKLGPGDKVGDRKEDRQRDSGRGR